jgi:FtsH-binding integral membrane protein
MNNHPKTKRHIEWNKVTWYSKLAALVFFIIVIAFSVYVGMEVQKIKDMKTYEITISRAYVPGMSYNKSAAVSQ